VTEPDLEVGRAQWLADAGRAVLAAWDNADDLKEAMEELRAVLPDVPADYDPRPYIARQRWTFAKTVPKHPHEYLLISASSDHAEHLRFMDWVNQTGEDGTFMGRRYRYRTVEGHTYWTSGLIRPKAGPNDTILNRRRAPETELPL